MSRPLRGLKAWLTPLTGGFWRCCNTGHISIMEALYFPNEKAPWEREMPLEIKEQQQNTRSFQFGVQQAYFPAHLPEQNSPGCAPVQPTIPWTTDLIQQQAQLRAPENRFILMANQYHFSLRWRVSICESLSLIHIHMTVEGVHLHPSPTPGSENETHQSKSTAFWWRQEEFLALLTFCYPSMGASFVNWNTSIYNHFISTLEYLSPDHTELRRYTSFSFECAVENLSAWCSSQTLPPCGRHGGCEVLHCCRAHDNFEEHSLDKAPTNLTEPIPHFKSSPLLARLP